MSTWTDSRIKLLTTLASEGWSAGQIGQKLRVTRNAVIGKVHRLGISLSQIAASLGVSTKPSRPQKRAKPKPWHPPIFNANAEVAATPAAEPVVIQADRPITLMDLTHRSCRWPLNNGYPEYYFCGKRCDPGPYCKEHFRKAYAQGKKS